MPSTLLVAYDAECAFCRSIADWARERDKGGSLVFFPIQNPELLRMAPELGGLPLHESIHGVDAATRQVSSGGGLWLQMLRRLPAWRWCALALSLPGLGALARLMFDRRGRTRCRPRAEWR